MCVHQQLIKKTERGNQKEIGFVRNYFTMLLRVASEMKVELSYLKEHKTYMPQSLTADDRGYLLGSLNRALYGTASVVRNGLDRNGI